MDIQYYDDAIIKYWVHRFIFKQKVDQDFIFRERMLGESIPKHIQKKIASQREARGLPPLDDTSEGSKKKKREKPTVDVCFYFHFLLKLTFRYAKSMTYNRTLSPKLEETFTHISLKV